MLQSCNLISRYIYNKAILIYSGLGDRYKHVHNSKKLEIIPIPTDMIMGTYNAAQTVEWNSMKITKCYG